MLAVVCFMLAAFLLGIFVIEWAARIKGLGRFPLFCRDDASVYRMASSQSGCFNRRYTWRYDRHGMRYADDPVDFSGAVILLGDSVVEGGLKLDQSQTLAALVEAKIGRTVYPVACHGWALANELGALAAIPDWTRAGCLIWFVNSGDLDTIGEGESEFSFPSHRPIWLSLWLLRRHLYRRNYAWWPWRHVDGPICLRPDLRQRALDRFAELTAEFTGQIYIVRYPQKGQSLDHEFFYERLVAVKEGARLISPNSHSEWGEDSYIDQIHLSAVGARRVADVIVQALRSGEALAV